MAFDSVREHAYAVVLAGGSGTRFWPMSRRALPKQLLQLLGRETLLEQTVARLHGLIPLRRTYVLTNEHLRPGILRLLPGLPAAQIIAEPVQRNTAPALGLAAHEIGRRDPEGIMVVLPSDQLILRAGEFRKILRAACRCAAVEGRSIVLGFKPTRPETGYGYIRVGREAGRPAGARIYHVDNFTEKPDLARAKRFVTSRRYLWNGGMFVWRASTLLDNLERYQTKMARRLARIAAAGGPRNRSAMRRLYPRLEKVSVDYALMEKISDVFVIPAEIGWSDVGSWNAIYDIGVKDERGNVRPRRSIVIDAERNLIVSPRKLVAAVGVRDLIVVETKDATLVCARDRSQDVGAIVRKLERAGWKEVL